MITALLVLAGMIFGVVVGATMAVIGIVNYLTEDFWRDLTGGR